MLLRLEILKKEFFHMHQQCVVNPNEPAGQQVAQHIIAKLKAIPTNEVNKVLFIFVGGPSGQVLARVGIAQRQNTLPNELFQTTPSFLSLKEAREWVNEKIFKELCGIKNF